MSTDFCLEYLDLKFYIVFLLESISGLILNGEYVESIDVPFFVTIVFDTLDICIIGSTCVYSGATFVTGIFIVSLLSMVCVLYIMGLSLSTLF